MTTTPIQLDRAFSAPDYADHFELVTRAPAFADIDDFIRCLALGQPSWLTGLSMGIRDQDRLGAIVAAGPLGPGDALGNWKLVDRTDRSVTLAEDMGIMAYRLVYTWLGPDRITAETEVVQTSRLVGRTYWSLATPLHCRFLSRMLRNAAAHAGIEGTVEQLA